MDLAFRTPLLDFFKRGDVARDVRLLAAQGAIAPRPVEQLALLVLLTNDTDHEIRQQTEATLQRLPAPALAAFLARSEVPVEIRDFFASRGVLPDASAGPASDEPLVESADAEKLADVESATVDADSVIQQVSQMTVPQKIRAAMKGTREMRALLVRDPNKLVALAVLSSPKLTDAEVEAFARMGSVGEDVLRTIGHTRAWVKNYGVAHALVRNAKTPLATSLTLLNRLAEGDVRRLSTDRNVPEPLRIAARKRM